MDPLTAIGLASAVIQFIDFGLKIAARLDDLNRATSAQVPPSLQAISTQLPLLLSSLGRMKTGSQISKLDFDSKCILRGVVAGCMAQIAKIEEIIEKVSAAPGDSFKVKIGKVFVSLRCDEQAWEIERNLHTYVSVLVLHHVVDASAGAPAFAADHFFDVREKRVSPFIERPALTKQLEDCLDRTARSQAQAPTLLLVYGKRGVGKTQLVLQYCHQAHSLGQFQTVFWLDASSSQSVALGFEAVFATVKRSMDASRAEKLEFVGSFLKDRWHPWLLVLDKYNAQEHEEIMELLPQNGHGGIIIISCLSELPGVDETVEVPRYLTQSDQAEVNNLLIQAVHNRSTAGIKGAVEKGADVNTLIWDEWPVLHRCVLLSLHEAVRFLLAQGANPCRVGTCSSALYWAAKSNSWYIFMMILDCRDESGSLWKQADYQAAAKVCAQAGNIGIMEAILRKTEEITAKGDYETPLKNAAGKGKAEMVKFLIGRGELKDNMKQGEDALVRAAIDGNFEIVKLLYEEGHVDLNARDAHGTTALCYVAKLKGMDRNAELGIEMARFLLERGADPNLCGKDEGPLHGAAIYDHPEMLQLLLKHGADIARVVNGWSPLKLAIKYNSPLAVTLISSYIVSPEDLDKRQEMINAALLYAAGKGDRDAILQVLQAGADINTRQTEEAGGSTPLLVAIGSGEMQSARLLVRRGAKLDMVGERGSMALEMAIRKGYELLARDIVEKGGDMKVKIGEHGDTVLGLAVRERHLKVVKVLLKKSVDLEGENKFGETALDIAEENGDEKIIALLEGREVEDE
ncbi:hypothetical protein MFRU_005g03250 [Monilinia fructicola]|nr:hypothetical protein MFRU_005g03250 [Monilinia fructicola]